jgi:hypothetical protein
LAPNFWHGERSLVDFIFRWLNGLCEQAQTRADLAEWVAAVTPVLLAVDVFLEAEGIDHSW